jgi:D-glycero-alpha-D-manno-heptose-7-phosphate kinase
MIITRTPFRISFTGGGSDIRAYYRRRPGAVVSAAIRRYMYVTVSRRFDDTVRVAYTRTEIVPSAAHVQHELVREAMKLTGVETGVEITTIADVPAGTGLGSSSSLTVGLLHALSAFCGRYPSPEQLARQACRIESEILARPIGKQDQYAAAYGGLNYIEFLSDENVLVHPIRCSPSTRTELASRLMMFFIAARPEDSRVLAEQQLAIEQDASARASLDDMAALARHTRDAIQMGDLDSFGLLLHENWQLKKRLHPQISSPQIDRWCQIARSAGAQGEKILGAGGAGFLLVFCARGAQDAVRSALQAEGLRFFPVSFAPEGSQVLLWTSE